MYVLLFFKVRAAAVYALGTFVNSVSERSEHANNIDHSIAMTLINTVSHDMSPLVRKVGKEINVTISNLIFAHLCKIKIKLNTSY